MKTIDTLERGEVLLVNAKGIKNGKVQLEFAEFISNPFASSSNSILADLNASSEAFQSSKPRRGWMPAEIADVNRLFGTELTSLEVGKVQELGILNPSIGGASVHLQIEESIKPSEFQKANIDKQSKRKGKNGDFILHNGERIFVNTDIVRGIASHIFLQPDGVVTETLAEAETEQLPA